MVDLALDSNFSVFLNDRNEVSTVDGRDEFEQSVRVMITEFMHNSILGEVGSSNIENKIRLEVSRVARKHDQISDISGIDISESENDANKYIVKIFYESDSLSEFEVTE